MVPRLRCPCVTASTKNIRRPSSTMRAWVALMWVVVALSGCTQGDDGGARTLSCDEIDTQWVQSPGRPGLGVNSFYNSSSEFFNMEGISVMKPSLLDKQAIEEGKVRPLYDWDGAILDVAQLTIVGRTDNGTAKSAAVDGYYTIEAWRSIKNTPHQSDGKKVTYDPADKRERLGFREDSRAAPVQMRIELRPNDQHIIENRTFYIEFAEPHEATNPGDLWLEWKFVPNVDRDQDTPSAGTISSNVTWWYRRC